MTTIIAIDPGASGAIVTRYANGAPPEVHNMPDTETDLANILADVSATHCVIWDKGSTVGPVAYVEWQNGCGGLKTNPVSMFKFGANYGSILGVLAALGIRTILVKPKQWIGAAGAGVRDKTKPKSVWKAKLRGLAQRLYPGIKVTLANADALLILEYATKQERNHT